jgi:hypothetical protein
MCKLEALSFKDRASGEIDGLRISPGMCGGRRRINGDGRGEFGREAAEADRFVGEIFTMFRSRVLKGEIFVKAKGAHAKVGELNKLCK